MDESLEMNKTNEIKDNMQENLQTEKKSPKKKKKMILRIIITTIVAIIIMLIVYFKVVGREPYVYFSDAKFAIGEEVTVDVKVSELPECYPAASFVIHFDKDQLEFVDIKQGTIKIIDKDQTSLSPEWEFHKDRINETGQVSTMYLDMTAGDRAFTKQGFQAKKRDILFRITFVPKYTLCSGDTIRLSFEQATFATLPGAGYTTLSLQDKNLKGVAKEYKVR